ARSRHRWAWEVPATVLAPLGTTAPPVQLWVLRGEGRADPRQVHGAWRPVYHGAAFTEAKDHDRAHRRTTRGPPAGLCRAGRHHGGDGASVVRGRRNAALAARLGVHVRLH